MKRKKVQRLIDETNQIKEKQENLLIEDSTCIPSSSEPTESIEVEVSSDDTNISTLKDIKTIGNDNQDITKEKFKGLRLIGSSIKWILNYTMRLLILIVNTFLGLIDGLQWLVISVVLTIAATFILRYLGISLDDIIAAMSEIISKK